jgi:hypothetical protein
VACTSTVLPSHSSAIELPSRERTPQAKSGLMRRTWAIPEWVLPVQVEHLVDRIGRLTPPTLKRLLEAIEQQRH